MEPIGLSTIEWYDPKDWRPGWTCLILCRGANPPTPEYKGQVSEHCGMASLPAGTIAWAPMPFPDPPGFF